MKNKDNEILAEIYKNSQKEPNVASVSDYEQWAVMGGDELFVFNSKIAALDWINQQGTTMHSEFDPEGVDVGSMSEVMKLIPVAGVFNTADEAFNIMES